MSWIRACVEHKGSMKGEIRMQPSSRRYFLLGVAGGAIGVLAAACAPSAPPAAAPTGAPAAGTAAPAAKPTEPPKPAAPTTAPAQATAAPAAKPTTPSAPAAAPTAAAASIKRGGALNWGEPTDPISFDPHNRNNASSTVLRRMVYESFTHHNPRTL